MTTLAISLPVYPRRRPLPLLPLVLACVVVATIYCAHAVASHPSAAQAVRDCMENQGPVAHLHNPDNNRDYYICEIEPGKYGVQILIKDSDGNYHEISSFIKNKMRLLEDVIRYVKNGSTSIYQDWLHIQP